MDDSLKKIDIPSIFKNHAGELFDHCIACETQLLGSEKPYMIEKAIKKYPGYEATDIVFEYAMCMDCAMKMRKELSRESLTNIQNYFEANTDLQERYEQMEEDDEDNPDKWLSHCIITGKPAQEMSEYQVYALCIGEKMTLSGMPYLLSGEAAEEMFSLLSEKTKGEIDRFIDDNFGIPPELKQPIKDQPVAFF